MTLKELSDSELATLNLAVSANFDVTVFEWYPRVKHLFTLENGTKMHQDVKRALYTYVNERL
jgi:hypothetical protein